MKKFLLIFIFAIAIVHCLGGSSSALLLEVTTGTMEVVSNEAYAPLSSSLPCFVQIIRSSSGIPLPIGDTPPDYLGPGETLLTTVELGTGFLFDPVGPDGHFATPNDVDVTEGQKIYVRAFNGNSVSTSTYYGNSGVYTATGSLNQKFIPDSFYTNLSLDFIPPAPPVSLEATPEPNLSIYLVWHNTIEADLASVEVRFRTNGVYPTTESEGTFFYRGTATSDAFGATTHPGLVMGTTYYYSIFSIDFSGNYSIGYATAFATAQDKTSPEVYSFSPTGSDAPITGVTITFTEAMSQESTKNAFKIYPDENPKTFSWPLSYRMTVGMPLLYSTFYIASVEVSAEDLAGNRLDPTPEVYPNSFTASFTTQAKPPDTTSPRISDFRIDGLRILNNDVISSIPIITAVISDEGIPANISSIELTAQSIVRYSGTPGSAFNTTTGTFEFAVSSGAPLPSGTYVLRLRAWDLPPDSNMTEEAFTVKVFQNEVGLVGPILNYPNPFSPGRGVGTYIAYTLMSDFDVTLYVYDISAHLLWKRRFVSGTMGGKVGYNEVFWDGKNAFKEPVSNGIVILKLVSGDRVLGTAKLTVLD